MSIDKREDAGDFYPGGKVISTQPLAPGGDVKHSDFAGLDVKTNTIPDLRDAVRELGRRLGATVVTALSACVAVAATVQTVPVNDLDFDANPSLVTNVTFEGLADATNVYTKAETDAAIAAATPEETDPTVPSWAKAESKPTYTASEISVDYVWGETMQEFSSNINSFLGSLPSPSDMLIKMYGDNRVATYSGGLYHPVEELYIGDHRAATVADIPNVPAWALEAQKPTYTAAEVGATSPAAVSNIVSTAYVHKKLGAWMEYDEATGLYYYCHEEE